MSTPEKFSWNMPKLTRALFVMLLKLRIYDRSIFSLSGQASLSKVHPFYERPNFFFCKKYLRLFDMYCISVGGHCLYLWVLAALWEGSLYVGILFIFWKMPASLCEVLPFCERPVLSNTGPTYLRRAQPLYGRIDLIVRDTCAIAKTIDQTG